MDWHCPCTGWYCTYGHGICVCSSGAYYRSLDSGGTTHCIAQTRDTLEQIGGRDAVFCPSVFGARADCLCVRLILYRAKNDKTSSLLNALKLFRLVNCDIATPDPRQEQRTRRILAGCNPCTQKQGRLLELQNVLDATACITYGWLLKTLLLIWVCQPRSDWTVRPRSLVWELETTSSSIPAIWRLGGARTSFLKQTCITLHLLGLNVR